MASGVESPVPGSEPLAGVRALGRGQGSARRYRRRSGKVSRAECSGSSPETRWEPAGKLPNLPGPWSSSVLEGFAHLEATRAGQAQVTEAARTVLGTEQLCRARWCRHHHRHMPLN